MNLTLVCSTLEDGIVELCVFFRRRREAPDVRRPGDVALLHNVVVNEHDGERNLKLALGRGDSGCAFFNPRETTTKPYATSGVVCLAEPPILECAKEFAQLWKTECPNYYISDRERRLESLEETSEVDIACYVAAVERSRDPKLLWIWDATDVQPVQVRKADSEEALRLGDAFVAKCPAMTQPVSQEGQEPMPSLGSLVAVAVMGEMRIEGMPSGWIKLRNVEVVRCHSQWILLFTDDTRWAPVPRIPAIHERYLQRLDRKEVAMHVEVSAVMTQVTSSLEPVPLRAVHEFLHRAMREGQSAQKDFRCFVYLMDCDPNVESIAQMLDSSDPQVRAELHLQDATGRVVAMLYGRHGVRFFGSPQAQIQEESKLKPAVVTNTLTKAIVSNNPVPWLDVCLRVIYKDQVQVIQVLDTTVT